MKYEINVFCEGYIEVEVVADTKEDAIKKVFDSDFVVCNDEFYELSAGDMSVDIVNCIESAL